MPDTLISDLTYIKTQTDALKTATGKTSLSEAVSSALPMIWSESLIPTMPAYQADWIQMPSVALGEEVFYFLLDLGSGTETYVYTYYFSGVPSANYVIDWGDGSAPENMTYTGTENFPHSYDKSILSTRSNGNRQVMVKITPQAGSHLIHLSPLPSSIAAKINSTYVTSGKFYNMTEIINVEILQHAFTTMSTFFYGCQSLQTINLFDTSLITNFESMFYSCESLSTIPLFDTSAGTNFSNMFRDCYYLKTIPAIDTGVGTNFWRMFYYCNQLKAIPMLNTGNGTDFMSMFESCYSLEYVPNLNTSKGLNMSGMFSQVFSLSHFPILDTSKATDLSSFIAYSSGLNEVQVDMSSCTICSSFASGTYGLKSLKILGATVLSSGWLTSNYNLQSIDVDMTNVVSIPSGDFIKYGNDSVNSLKIPGCKVSIDLDSAKLDKQNIIDIFNGLATVTGMQISFSSSSPGFDFLSAQDISIATNKGWTVTK